MPEGFKLPTIPLPTVPPFISGFLFKPLDFVLDRFGDKIPEVVPYNLEFNLTPTIERPGVGHPITAEGTVTFNGAGMPAAVFLLDNFQVVGAGLTTPVTGGYSITAPTNAVPVGDRREYRVLVMPFLGPLNLSNEVIKTFDEPRYGGGITVLGVEGK